LIDLILTFWHIIEHVLSSRALSWYVHAAFHGTGGGRCRTRNKLPKHFGVTAKTETQLHIGVMMMMITPLCHETSPANEE
jgi:hypothetical protein